jgi:hypothetical protein
MAADPPAAAGSLERMILNAMPSSVLALDPGLAVRFVNPAAEQLFGASRTMLENRPLSDLIPFDSALFDLIRRVQLAGNSVSDYGVELPLNRSLTRLVDLHVSPVAEHEGHSLVVLHPCAVAQRLNRQLTHRGGARSIAGLGATLAHEVKNPLSGIRGAAQLLEHGVADEERPLIRLICDETDRICALVDRMEQFADRGPIERRPVNIYQVLEHVRRLAESGFASKLRFEANYDPSLPAVDGDRDQLENLEGLGGTTSTLAGRRGLRAGRLRQRDDRTEARGRLRRRHPDRRGARRPRRQHDRCRHRQRARDDGRRRPRHLRRRAAGLRLRGMIMKTFLIACAGALAISGAALAQDITTGHLDALDADDNGAVDAAEFDAFMGQTFSALDTNGDGYISAAESAGFMSPDQFAAANTNGDDGISAAEFTAATPADFAAPDRDGDGVLK